MNRCEVLYQSPYSKARVTRFHTAHGMFTTPRFMPVGTRAGVNNLSPDELRACGAELILGGNTYHMLCAPGLELIVKAGGMHAFMGWNGPMLTDSGGFQVFSLSRKRELCTIDELGAHFKLPDQQWIHMTPKLSLETQKKIGADIIMAFDQCTPSDCSRDEANQIMQRTHRWLLQSIDYHQRFPLSHYGSPQALFGIIQGGTYSDLRQESAEFLVAAHTDGIAIGGESIGFDMKLTVEVVSELVSFLPESKLRYTMGLGMSPQDLLDVVFHGMDIFDCVAPTRNARHGALYSGRFVEENNWLRFDSEFPQGRIQIKKAEFMADPNPIMSDCACYTCANFSRSYLHHLFKGHQNVFTVLASIHNIYLMQDVCAKMRDLIKRQAQGKFL